MRTITIAYFNSLLVYLYFFSPALLDSTGELAYWYFLFLPASLVPSPPLLFLVLELYVIRHKIIGRYVITFANFTAIHYDLFTLLL